MSEGTREVRFTRLGGWGPEDGTGIGGTMQDRDPAAGPRAISGGTIEGVPEGVSDAQARETLRGALRLWTDAGASPEKAFTALAQIAHPGARWRFDDIAHAARVGAVQAAMVRDGQRPDVEVERTRTLIESGLGAGAQLRWAAHEAREQGEDPAARNERRTRARYEAVLDAEAQSEPAVQIPGDTRASWTDRRLIESGATVAAMGEIRLLRAVRTLLTLGAGGDEGSARVRSALGEAHGAGGAQAHQFVESAIEMVEAGRNDLGMPGTGQTRGQALHTWLGEAQVVAAGSRGGRPLDAGEIEEAKALARRAVGALGPERSVSPRGALCAREAHGRGESAARAAEREWAGTDPRILRSSVLAAPRPSTERERAGTDPRILRAATRALGGALVHLPQSHAEVAVREAALEEAAGRDTQGPMAMRILAERSVRAVVGARLRLPDGREVRDPSAEIGQYVHRALEQQGGDPALAALARRAAKEVEAAGEPPDLHTALAAALDGVWDAKRGSTEHMRCADPEKLEGALAALAETPAARLGVRPGRKDVVMRMLGEGAQAAREWTERESRATGREHDARGR